jgi:sulfur-carrier protein
MKKIKVLYFATLRDERGIREELLETAAKTPLEIYAALKTQHGFTPRAESMRVAVNDEYCPWDVALHDQDTLSFIPPVAGG